MNNVYLLKMHVVFSFIRILHQYVQSIIFGRFDLLSVVRESINL